MSGGIDSSVAALLLKQQGYELIGVHLKFWHEDENNLDANKCCTLESAERARAVAEYLDFPFYVLNFKDAFKEKVVDYFIEASQYETPNPCVRCNREIKFGKLLQKMKELDCDFLATGHYARIKESRGFYKLLKAKDPKKDQSYFLHTLTQEKLKYVLFPLGNYNKTQVRKLAEKFHLPVIEKAPKESMDLCFCAEREPQGFLRRNLKLRPGGIEDSSGKIYREQHEGLPLYTIGQRKGIKIGGLSEPVYVTARNHKTNILVVGMDEELYEKTLKLKDLNFISGQVPDKAVRVQAKIRYGTPAVPATLKAKQLTFKKPVRAITPGQSVVFYKGDEVLGGGVIC